MMKRLILLALLLAVFLVALPVSGHSYPMFCNFPGAGEFEVVCRLDWVGTYDLSCGGVEYLYANPVFCTNCWTYDESINEYDTVRLAGNIVAGVPANGGLPCYGPECLWIPGSYVVFRMDFVSAGRLPFSFTWSR